MTHDEIEAATRLSADADTDHEDARGWYDSYGWHLTTEDAGDVMLQAVRYDWLDDEDDAVITRLRKADSDLSADEAESIVTAARSTREAAESICDLLDEAVEAYERGDLDGAKQALLSAYSQESDHGDTPATSVLAGNLLEAAEDD